MQWFLLLLWLLAIRESNMSGLAWIIVSVGRNRVPDMMCLTPFALALVLVACVKVRKAK